MKKLLFVDIDGTITRNNGKITKSMKNILRNYHDIVFTTGRVRDNVKMICDDLGLRYFISSYGSEVYDNDLNKVIYCNTLNSDTVISISKLVLSFDLVMTVAIDDKDILITEFNYFSLSNGVKQCMVKGTNENLDKFRKELKKIKGIKYQRDNAFENGYYWFGIIPDDTNKGNAALFLMNYLNIDKSNTISFGNDCNDLSLFNVTGHSVAVGNSCEELKRAASIIIGDNNSDSVRDYIRSIIS